MATPVQAPTSAQETNPANRHLTPPAESTPPSHSNPITSSQANTTAANPATTTATATTNPTATAPTISSAPGALPAEVPATSLRDSGKSRRPRDVRLIHMLLASLGVTAYQERVPLQLLDFAYRYTSGVLQDAVYLASEGYAGAVAPADVAAGPGGGGATRGGGGGGGGSELSSVSLQALRLSIASRLHYQFQTGLPKEFLMDVAAERNRIALPGAAKYGDAAAAAAAAGGGAAGGKAQQQQGSSVMMGGMRLPPEKFCLTGAGWNLKDEWESDGEEDVDVEGTAAANATGEGDGAGTAAGVLDTGVGEGDEEDEEGDGRMEDVFGEDTTMADGGDEDGDKAMTDV